MSIEQLLLVIGGHLRRDEDTPPYHVGSTANTKFSMLNEPTTRDGSGLLARGDSVHILLCRKPTQRLQRLPHLHPHMRVRAIF